MKKILLFITVMIFSVGVYAQGDLENTGYIRFGYSKPTKTYWGIDDKDAWDDGNIKRNGFMFETGKIFYFKSLNMPDGLGIGINADWVSLNYQVINAKDWETKFNHILLGSKVGPVISFSPVDKLVIDGYAKFNPVWVSSMIIVSENADESEIFLGFVGVGYSLGLNFRYSALMLGFEFNKSWNKLQYKDSDDGFDGDYFGNMGEDDGDDDKDATPLPSWNFTIGLAF